MIASAVVLAAIALLNLRLHESARIIAGSTLLLVLLMLLITGSGALRHELQGARMVALRRGRRFAAANAQVLASMSFERDLVLAQERARSARELHDGLGHRLTLTAMSLQFALKAKDKDAGQAWAEVDNASDTTAAAREVIRGWARAAGASADAAGAAVTVETIADAFRGAGLEVRVRHTGMEERMPEPVADFVARLVEEA